MSLFNVVEVTKFQRFASAVLCVLLVGCGPARSGATDEPTPTPTWEPVATFTPTTPPQHTATPIVVAATPAPAALEPAAAVAVVEPVTPEGSVVLTPTVAPTTNVTVPEAGHSAEVEAALTPTAELSTAQLFVTADAANVRSGPGTEYTQIGVVTRDTNLTVTGRNEAGDWWQFCCVNEQPGWLFGALVTVQNAESVVVVAAPPLPMPPTPEPVAQAALEEAAPVESAPVESAPLLAESAPAEESIPAPAGPGEHSGTAGNFDPNAQYQIVHYRVLGFDDNNGGIFNKGGQQFIFLTVLDQNGNGVDGAVVKVAVGDKLTIVTGDKGPGKNEIKMDWDPYKLYVASDPSGPVTSQVSNQMNNPYPHIPDVIGKLGPPENEYAICPTPDDRCTPPFYHAHWSYEITFQKVR